MSEDLSKNFSVMVSSLVKPGGAILGTLDDRKVHILHMLIGLTGEVGEIVDNLKRPIIYNSNWDFKNLVEELGDIEFYLEGIRQELGIDRDTVLATNIEKLAKRYSGGTYSDTDANARKDKLQ